MHVKREIEADLGVVTARKTFFTGFFILFRRSCLEFRVSLPETRQHDAIRRLFESYFLGF